MTTIVCIVCGNETERIGSLPVFCLGRPPARHDQSLMRAKADVLASKDAFQANMRQEIDGLHRQAALQEAQLATGRWGNQQVMQSMQQGALYGAQAGLGAWLPERTIKCRDCGCDVPRSEVTSDNACCAACALRPAPPPP
jgi:hypothetical protein